MIYNEKISISVSNLYFNNKQETEKKAKKLLFTPSSLDLSEITDLISNGYVFANIFQPDFQLRQFTMYEKKAENFVSSQFITVDIDGIEEYDTLSSLLSNINLLPSLAYTTLSHKTTDEEGKYKGNRYRIIYIFNEKINTVGQYKLLYNCVVTYLQTQINNLQCDSHMQNPSQMFYGSTAEQRNNKEVYNNNVIYNISDFLDFNPTKQTKERKYLNSFEKLEEAVYTINNNEFIKDFKSTLDNEALVKKYSDKYELFEQTPLPVVDNKTKFIILPDNFMVISRQDESVYNTALEKKVYTGNKRKYRNGEHRREKISMNAIIRRYMIPDITLDHLLYCLMWELTTYYINVPGNDFITRKQIMNITMNAFSIDFKGENVVNWFKKNKDKRKYIVNKEYATKNDTTVQYLTNTGKKEINDMLISKYYDSTLSVKENLEILNNNGVNIKIRRLYNYISEKKCGVKVEVKPKKQRKEKVFKEVIVETEDVAFGGETTQEFKQFIEEHTHISAPCAPTTTKTTAKTTNDVEPQTENKMENEVQINEAVRIQSEVYKKTEGYNKLNSMLIIDALKDYQLKFNKKISEEEVKEIFEVIENRCIRFVLAAIRTDYDDYKDKKQLINKYTNLVPNEYKEKITEYINELI